MKNLSFIVLFFLVVACKQNSEKITDKEDKAVVEVVETEPTFFELRTYYCHPDKLDDLLDRFNNHTMDLFKKHGMVNMGYWVPIENKDNTLVYLLGYENEEARDKTWKAFGNDPEWKKVWEASRENGPIVDSVSNQLFTYTDYSPILKQEDKSPRIFSIRTYVTNPGKLNDLHTRFRDHTMKIFENNGMTNIAYFNLIEEGQPNENTLIYMLSFPDTTAQKESWNSFLQDPEWQSVYAKSIENGKIVNTITDVLLEPTSFSPLK